MNKNISILLLLLQSLFAMVDETSESIIRFSHQKTVKSVDYIKSDKSLKIPTQHELHLFCFYLFRRFCPKVG